MKAIALTLQSDIVTDSAECTHLIVNHFAATTKVLQCLVDQKPIVKIDWLQSFAGEQVTAAPAIPPVDAFSPTSEYNLQGSRSTVFADLIVIFVSDEDVRDYDQMLRKCGAIVEVCRAAESHVKTVELVQAMIRAQSKLHSSRKSFVFLREDRPVKDILSAADVPLLFPGFMAKCILQNKNLSDVLETHSSQVQVLSSQSQYASSQTVVSLHENPVDFFEEVPLIPKAIPKAVIVSSVQELREFAINPLLDPPKAKICDSGPAIVVDSCAGSEIPSPRRLSKRGRPDAVVAPRQLSSPVASPIKKQKQTPPLQMPLPIPEPLTLPQITSSLSSSSKSDIKTHMPLSVGCHQSSDEFSSRLIIAHAEISNDDYNDNYVQIHKPLVTGGIIDVDGWITNGAVLFDNTDVHIDSFSSSKDEVKYVKAVTIDQELDFVAQNSSHLRATSQLSSSKSIPGNDKRKFKKNFVRVISDDEVIFNANMDLVLPKESEREIQVPSLFIIHLPSTLILEIYINI
jgi:hypothetical protein